MQKGLWRILIEALTSSICEPFQENVFEAGNSTYAMKGLLYLDTTCHFSRWKDTHLWKAFLGKYKTKYVLSLSFSYMYAQLFIIPLLVSYYICLHSFSTRLSANWGLEALIIFD